MFSGLELEKEYTVLVSYVGYKPKKESFVIFRGKNDEAENFSCSLRRRYE